MGIADKEQWLLNQIRIVMRRVLETAKDELGEESPSKRFAEIGRYSAMGYEIGFVEKMDAAERTIRRAVSNTIPEPISPYPESSGGRETTGAGFFFTQNVYANETSYAAQQREAARQFRAIARRL